MAGFPGDFPFWFGGGDDEDSGVLIAPPPGAEEFSDEFVPALQWVDHVALGLSRLLEQWKELPVIQDLLTTWLTPIQDLENTVWSLKLLMGLTTSEGAQLDRIGMLVGERERGGDSDTVYRIRIFARIAVNVSNGRREDLLAVASTLLGEGVVIRAREFFPASLGYEVVGPIAGIPPLQLARILRLAKAAGVRLFLTYTESVEDDTFLCDSVYGDFTTPGQFPGTDYDSSLGGNMASVNGT